MTVGGTASPKRGSGLSMQLQISLASWYLLVVGMHYRKGHGKELVGDLFVEVRMIQFVAFLV